VFKVSTQILDLAVIALKGLPQVRFSRRPHLKLGLGLDHLTQKLVPLTPDQVSRSEMPMETLQPLLNF